MNSIIKKLDIKAKLPAFGMWVGFAFLGVLLDQISKLLVLRYLPKEGVIKVIPYVFNFTYVENKGAAWGMLADHRWVFMVVSTIAIIALLFVLLYYARSSKMFCVCLCMILCGGVGNMIDRIALGYVVDFIQFGFWTDFPVFNVADSFITVGCVLTIVFVLFFDKTIFRDTPKTPQGTENDENGDN